MQQATGSATVFRIALNDPASAERFKYFVERYVFLGHLDSRVFSDTEIADSSEISDPASCIRLSMRHLFGIAASDVVMPFSNEDT
jgi:hypothetical protein